MEKCAHSVMHLLRWAQGDERGKKLPKTDEEPFWQRQ